MRPYINSAIPVYATSQVFSGNTNTLTNYDLADVRFVDMPWMLQPDHPAVMIYPRVVPAVTPDLERLYALGIDAYRLLQVLYQHNPANRLAAGRRHRQDLAEAGTCSSARASLPSCARDWECRWTGKSRQ